MNGTRPIIRRHSRTIENMQPALESTVRRTSKSCDRDNSRAVKLTFAQFRENIMKQAYAISYAATSRRSVKCISKGSKDTPEPDHERKGLIGHDRMKRQEIVFGTPCSSVGEVIDGVSLLVHGGYDDSWKDLESLETALFGYPDNAEV